MDPKGLETLTPQQAKDVETAIGALRANKDFYKYADIVNGVYRNGEIETKAAGDGEYAQHICIRNSR